MADDVTHTSPTLLGRLSRDPYDQVAWSQFARSYGPPIYNWCCRRGLQEADSQDITQNVLLKLAEKMRAFRYDPARSFRAWLKTVTHHAVSDFLMSKKELRLDGDLETRQGKDLSAEQQLIRVLEEEHERAILEEAMLHVRLKAEPQKWEAFRLLALEGLSGGEVAARLGMSLAAVYLARSSVQKRLRREVRKLQGSQEE